jgi:hypothetical protein
VTRTAARDEPFESAPEQAVAYRALGVGLTVASDDPVLGSRAHALLAPLRSDAVGEAVGRQSTVRLSRDGDGCVMRVDRRGPMWFPTDGALLDQLQWYLNSEVIDELSHRGTGFHACALQRGAVTLLCPAASESGKSTLAALLVRAGWSYLSDEAVELASDGRLLAYPKAITVDAGSQPFFPEVRPAHQDTASWYVDPGAWGRRPAAVPARPTIVLLPSFVVGSSPMVRLLTPGAAVLALASTTFIFRRDPERNLRALGGLVRSVPVLAMEYSTPEGALDCVRQALEETRA